MNTSPARVTPESAAHLRAIPGAHPYTTLAAYVNAHPRGHDRRTLTTLYSRRSLERALREGSIVRVLPGIYIGSRHARDHAALCDAALLWSDGQAIVTGTSAAFLHGLLETPPQQVSLLADRATHLHAPDWIRVHRVSVPVTPIRIRGLIGTPIVDTMLMAWGQLPRDRATSMVLDAVRDRKVRTEDLTRRALDYPRIPGRRALSQLLSVLGQGVESYLEFIAQTRVFNTREFSDFERQVEMRIGGRKYVLDMFHATSRVAVELDGRRFHGNDTARRRDLARDADLASVGITTIRLTFEDVTGRPQWCRSRIRRAVSAHLRLRAV